MADASASWRWSTIALENAWPWSLTPRSTTPATPRDDRQRQRHRADLECHPRLGGRDRRRVALHRARQTAAERLHRELQWPAARRVVERDAVPFAASRP